MIASCHLRIHLILTSSPEKRKRMYSIEMSFWKRTKMDLSSSRQTKLWYMSWCINILNPIFKFTEKNVGHLCNFFNSTLNHTTGLRFCRFYYPIWRETLKERGKGQNQKKKKKQKQEHISVLNFILGKTKLSMLTSVYYYYKSWQIFQLNY